jgi:hypothetical protein
LTFDLLLQEVCWLAVRLLSQIEPSGADGLGEREPLVFQPQGGFRGEGAGLSSLEVPINKYQFRGEQARQ